MDLDEKGEAVAPISYSQILDVLKAGLKVNLKTAEESRAFPNLFIFFFNPANRKARARGEEFFIEELTRDIVRIEKVLTASASSEKIQVEFRTDANLPEGRFRIDCFYFRDYLFRLEGGESVAPRPVATEKKTPAAGPEDEEWTGLDILPNEKIEADSNILVVDDEPVLCAVLSRMLTRLGYGAVTAQDGLAALKMFSSMDFDLVITDLRMPHMDGWALMKEVKSRKPGIPVVFITGYHSIHTQRKATALSADGYISKPFSFGQIKQLVENLL